MLRPWLALLVLAAGCASAPTPEELAHAEQVAEALGRVVRLHYDQRLAAAGVTGAPAPAELAGARTRLTEALTAAGERPDAAGASLAAWADAARTVLIRGGYVFLPIGDDPGICVAHGDERATGLRQPVFDLTARYRRVTHRGVTIPSFAHYAALKSGRAPVRPLGRREGPTVFLDLEAIERHAGRGPFHGLSAERLRRLVEAHQAALIWLDDQDPAAWRVEELAPERRAACALLAALYHQGGPEADALLARLADGDPDSLGPLTARLARLLVRALRGRAVAAAAPACYADLRLPRTFAAAWVAGD